VPSRLSAGSPGWNVYPLSSVAGEDLNEDGLAPDSATRIPATAPFATLQQLLGYAAPTAAGDPTSATDSTDK
jgi:hypothetical protein